MKKGKLKIAFVGLYDERNLGDPIIFDSTEWLFARYFNCEYSSERLYLDYIEKTTDNKFSTIIKKRINRYYNLFDEEKGILKQTKEYFREKTLGVDLIVVVGGGLIKYKHQKFHILLPALLSVAEEKGTAVVINSVGIEGYSKTDKRCLELKQSLHLPCLKFISTRDDINTLVHDYFDDAPAVPTCKVADPAVWASEVYGVKRRPSSKPIGIGIARGKLFMDHGVCMKPEELRDKYIHLIEQLAKEGFEVMIFTNGLNSDNEFAVKISNALLERGHIIGCLLPTTPKELLSIIASFRAIIATRLHSCIVAYSLNVPAIGLVWNDKLRLFGENINCPDYYLNPLEHSIEHIVEQMKNAIERGYDQEHKSHFRDSIVDSISSIGKSYKL